MSLPAARATGGGPVAATTSPTQSGKTVVDLLRQGSPRQIMTKEAF